jgi:hypothetical protein
MNREQQAARIQKIVNTIAERAVTVPPEIRPAYIREEEGAGGLPPDLWG